MTTKNEITGDEIKTSFNSSTYSNNLGNILSQNLDPKLKELVQWFVDGTPLTDDAFKILSENGLTNHFPDGTITLSTKGRKYLG